MERIKVHDKYFKIFIPNSQIEEAIKKTAEKINNDFSDEDCPIFLSVLTGSFMFTASLMKEIKFECEMAFIKLSSYSGTQSTGTIKQVMGLTKDVKGRKVIIIEDIVDTGKTIMALLKILENAGAADVKICTLIHKPDSYKEKAKLDYVAINIPNDFIVGYGLDYDEYGRQYKDIYVLDQD